MCPSAVHLYCTFRFGILRLWRTPCWTFTLSNNGFQWDRVHFYSLENSHLDTCRQTGLMLTNSQLRHHFEDRLQDWHWYQKQNWCLDLNTWICTLKMKSKARLGQSCKNNITGSSLQVLISVMLLFFLVPAVPFIRLTTACWTQCIFASLTERQLKPCLSSVR